MTVTFLDDLTLFRDDLTYEELQDVVLFLVKKVLIDFDFNLQPRIAVNNAAVFMILRSLISDDVDLKQPDIYNDTMLGHLELVYEVAPDILKERMEPLLFLYRQEIASKNEKDARTQLVKNNGNSTHGNDEPIDRHWPYDDGMMPGYA